MHQRLSKYWNYFIDIMKQKKARRAFYILVIVLSLLFITYATYSNWNELKNQKFSINYFYLLLSVFLFPVGMLPTVVAWHNLLKALGVRLSFRNNLRIYAISSLPRHIPGVVWYVSSRTMLYQEQGVIAAISLAATGMELVLMAITGFIVSGFLLLIGATALEKYTFLQYLIPAAIVVAIGLLFSTPVINKLSQRLVSRGNLEQTPMIRRKYLGASLLWLFIAWSGGGLLLFLLVRGLTPMSWSAFPIMIGVWGFASAIGLTIGIGVSGMGLREITLGALLSLVIPPWIAVFAAIAYRLAFLIGEFIWVGIIVWITKSAPGENQERKNDRAGV